MLGPCGEAGRNTQAFFLAVIVNFVRDNCGIVFVGGEDMASLVLTVRRLIMAVSFFLGQGGIGWLVVLQDPTDLYVDVVGGGLAKLAESRLRRLDCVIYCGGPWRWSEVPV